MMSPSKTIGQERDRFMKRVLMVLALGGMLAMVMGGCGTSTPNRLTIYDYGVDAYCEHPTCPNIPKQDIRSSHHSSNATDIGHLYAQVLALKDTQPCNGKLPFPNNSYYYIWSRYLFYQDSTQVLEVQILDGFIAYAQSGGPAHCKIADTAFNTLVTKILSS
jgi:hypothetical protein